MEKTIAKGLLVAGLTIGAGGVIAGVATATWHNVVLGVTIALLAYYNAVDAK